jgi:hypothetical protein
MAEERGGLIAAEAQGIPAGSARAGAPGPGAVDLHLHSRESDGVLSPTALLARAARAGLRLIALTDHDTVAGLPEARAAATGLDVQLIDGIELSCAHRGATIHILGLAFDAQAPALQQLLERIHALRRARAAAIAARLEAAGVPDALARCHALAGHDRLTRTHFARLLVASGVARDLKRAFRTHLADGRGAAVRAEWPGMTEAVTALHAAGGFAVLAHPLRYAKTHSGRDRILRSFAEAGGDALEISTAARDPEATGRLLRTAREHRLSASAGSDFHDPEQRWIRLGTLPRLPEGIPPLWAHPRWPQAQPLQTPPLQPQ